jgi:TrfA protein.
MKRTAKSAIDSVKAALVKTQRDELIHTSDDELRQSQLSLFDLAPWDDDMRAMPNDYARSALFTVRNKKKNVKLAITKPYFMLTKM